MKLAAASALVMSLLVGHTRLLAECIEMPRKPVKVSGALCGTAVLKYGGRVLNDVELRLYDDAKHIDLIATAHTDAKGHFHFPPLKNGTYRVDPPAPFMIFWDRVVVTDAGAVKCKDPVYVYVGLPYPDCAWGFVSKKGESAIR
jgi:hypothetical protein